MSANLLDGITPTLMNGTTESDGVWHNAGRTSTDGHKDWLMWDLPDQAALAANQTYHVGLSVKGATAYSTGIRPTIGYMDSAGHKNWAVPAPLVVGTSWGRVEATIVVPSGMRPFALYVAAYGVCPETWMAAPTLSLGSPVTLASSAHTPYATQDHVSVTYATKASLKVTDDSIKAEVSARAQTDQNVADLSSRLTQTANSLTSEISDRRSAISTVTGLANAAQSTATAAQTMATENQSSIKQLSTSITAEVTARTKTDRMVSEVSSRLTQTADGLSASISKLSETDEKVNAWFDFEADSSGNPQLKMGSSTSPVVGTYTNSGLAYKSRDGATIMELDASRSATISDHMEAQDMRVGKWKWVQTQGGTHLTLVWEG